MSATAMTEQREILELVPLVYEHVTDIEVQIIDGRVYVTCLDTRPEGLVAVGKAVIPANGALDTIIDRLLMIRAMRDRARAAGRYRN